MMRKDDEHKWPSFIERMMRRQILERNMEKVKREESAHKALSGKLTDLLRRGSWGATSVVVVRRARIATVRRVLKAAEIDAMQIKELSGGKSVRVRLSAPVDVEPAARALREEFGDDDVEIRDG
ncbi:hypothetical protein [Streptomyces nojiriensis]|uniref:hypothetical protein n=1 Tax=Streptomyces nojiriensis TaxID=66374 RepID=UPI0036676625